MSKQKYLVVKSFRTSIGIMNEVEVVGKSALKRYAYAEFVDVYPVEKALTIKQKADLGMNVSKEK